MAKPTRDKPAILISAAHYLDLGDAQYPTQAPEPLEQSRLNAAYYDAVAAAGGLPLIAPPLVNPADIGRLLDLAQGVLLTGGPDLRAATFGQPDHPRANLMTERREHFDLALARMAVERQLPLFAICLGIQVLNVAAGGTLYQHLPDAVGTRVEHSAPKREAAHPVTLKPESRVARLVGATSLLVNSTHHQAVDRVADAFLATGRCDADGVIEALEARDPAWFALGVQWHPERLIDQPAQLALFRGLVEAARAQAGR